MTQVMMATMQTTANQCSMRWWRMARPMHAAANPEQMMPPQGDGDVMALFISSGLGVRLSGTGD